MFHLLKNTTMVPDFMAQQACDDSIVITKWTDYEWRWPTQIVEAHVHCKQKYGTFEQWYEQSFANDVDFLTWVYNTREIGIQIYADCEAYAKIVAKWLNFICPTLNDQQAYTIYKLSAMWFYVQWIHLKLYTNSLLVSRETLIDNYKFVSYDQFKQYRQQLLVDDSDQIRELKNAFQNYISNEFKYAFFLNGDESFRSMVEEHVNKALTRCLRMELNGYKFVTLFDIIYNNVEKQISEIDSELFGLIKQTSKMQLQNDQLDQSLDALYKFGKEHDYQLMTYNNGFLDQYYQIITGGLTLEQKLEFIADLAEDKMKTSEFIDLFTTSYRFYNLFLIRWIIDLWRNKDPQFGNFVY